MPIKRASPYAHEYDSDIPSSWYGRDKVPDWTSSGRIHSMLLELQIAPLFSDLHYKLGGREGSSPGISRLVALTQTDLLRSSEP